MARMPFDQPSKILVAARMNSMPIPRAPDDVVDRWEPWLPKKIAANFLGAGDKDGRVAAASRSFPGRDWVARDFARGFDHFPNTKTFAIA